MAASWTDSQSYQDIIDEVRKQKLYSKDELIEKFGWEEYFIFAMMLAVSAGIGIFFYWRGQHNNAQFLLGGKSMGTLPMTMSLIARYEATFQLLQSNNVLKKYVT